MRRSAAERGRDGFGRLVPADADAVARAWLATARHLDEGVRSPVPRGLVDLTRARAPVAPTLTWFAPHISSHL
ncbi:hypothetical protein [Streptomyces sp. NPDC058441]|uniref:hypothetical protein n=1 Tax=Streptomyces sp. NPDC058441 TaxID=3346502 RepID=UPI003668C92F